MTVKFYSVASRHKLKRKPTARWPKIVACTLTAAAILVLGGCRATGFYGQAIIGQLEILARQQSLPSLMKAPGTPEPLKARITLVLEIRQFAATSLALPVGDHYLTYIDLGRPHAVYSVFAAPEFSLTPKTWCYPIVGCAPYRGYFSDTAAREYADNLRAEAYDVYVAGVPAYSTLGWFNDPILNTFVFWDPADLAALIFHELAHQVLYLKDDATFNESFATTVAQEGIRRWLEAAGDSRAYERYRGRLDRQKEFVDLVLDCRRHLETLYATNLPEAEMRIAKEDELAVFKRRYRVLRQGWGGAGEYDAWVDQALNNAQLLTIAAYHDLVPSLKRLLSVCHGDLGAFFNACRRLADLSAEERRLRLSDPQSLVKLTGLPCRPAQSQGCPSV